MARPKAFAETDVLHEAMLVFWQKGYHAASMQDLVEAMGINRASLYDTFGDKHALYLRALACFAEMRREEYERIVHTDETPPVRLNALLTQHVQDLIDAEQRGCFLANATLEMLPHDPDVASLLDAEARKQDQLLTTLLEEGRADGSWPTTRPTPDVVQALTTQLFGMRVLAKLHPNRPALENVAQMALRLVG